MLSWLIRVVPAFRVFHTPKTCQLSPCPLKWIPYPDKYCMRRNFYSMKLSQTFHFSDSSYLKPESCTTRKEVVALEHQAMECDLCDLWEHVSFVRECDRVNTQLYKALKKSRSKNILYVCSRCRKLGSIAKCICKLRVRL